MVNVKYNKRKNNTDNEYEGDLLKNLPVDDDESTNDNEQIQIINTLFNTKNGDTKDKLVKEIKNSLVLVFLVVLICLPQTEKLIQTFIPITNKLSYLTYLIKGLLVASIFWVIQHFYLAKK